MITNKRKLEILADAHQTLQECPSADNGTLYEAIVTLLVEGREIDTSRLHEQSATAMYNLIKRLVKK